MLTKGFDYFASLNGEEEWIPIFNDKVAVRMTEKETQGEFGLFEIESLPGGGVPMHVHEREDELFFVIDGEVTFEMGDKTFVGGQGSVVVLPREVPHAWWNKTDKTIRTFVMVRPSGFEHFFAENLKLGGDIEKMCALLKSNYGVTML